MKKNYFFLFFLFCVHTVFAQIAIDSVGVDKQAIVDVTSKNKAVLFPRIDNIINEKDISFLKENTEDLVPMGLLVFNKALSRASLEKGYYYWNNNKWNLLIDSESVYSRFTIDKLSNTQTTAVAYIKDFFPQANTLPTARYNDEIVVEDGFKWVELEGLDYTFEIVDTKHSNVFVKVSGTAQYATSDYMNLILGMNLGIFLQRIDEGDNKFRLQGISSINLDNIRNSNCHLFNYSLQTAIGKLSPGMYRIKSYVSGNKNYNNVIDINDKWITLGGKSTSDNDSSNADCTNSSDNQLIARQTVVISENENEN